MGKQIIVVIPQPVRQQMHHPMSVSGFLEYLRGTLIPDLKESGREFTAQDFEDAATLIEGLAQMVSDGGVKKFYAAKRKEVRRG